MKTKFFFISTIFLLFLTFIFSSDRLNTDGAKLSLLAPDRKENNKRLDSPIKRNNYQFNIPRNMNAVLIDSSANGYGLITATTRPIDRFEDNWIIAYRQYAGEGTTHGQLGTAYTEDILGLDDWTVYTNVNFNGNPEWGGGGICEDGTCAQARYPSALASEDYPYAIWTEYTGQNSTFGGRPYITYDEFGWDGDSYAYPFNIDLDWFNEPKDLWQGSAEYSWNSDWDMGIINVVYEDWSRSYNHYLFHSEVIEDGLVIFGQEQMVVDWNFLNPDGHEYSSDPCLSINDDGQGILGLTSYIPSCENTMNKHIPIFKLTDDHGYTFYGDYCDGYYYVPSEIFDDILNSNSSLTEDCQNDFDGYGVDIDYDGDGIIEEVETGLNPVFPEEFFSWYTNDFRVDSEGNIHILSILTPTVFDYDDYDFYSYYFGGATGIYHFTIDREYIDNPGQINTETGWNWSFLADLKWAFGSDVDSNGTLDVHDTVLPQLSFSSNQNGVVWSVFNNVEMGYINHELEEYYESCWSFQLNGEGIDPNYDDLTYSYDLFIAKSIDGGKSWSNPVNISQTSGDFLDGAYRSPDEMHPHTPTFSDDENVYFMYQMPNWNWNEIGDQNWADFMNYVYVGYAGEDIDFTWGEEDNPCNNYMVGDTDLDGTINILDIITIINIIFENIDPDACQEVVADINQNGNINIADCVLLVNLILNN